MHRYCTTHPATRKARRTCRTEARLHAGAIVRYRRPAPIVPDHGCERRVQREHLAIYRRRHWSASPADREPTRD